MANEYRLTARESGMMEKLLFRQKEAEQKVEAAKQETRAALMMLIESHDLPEGDWNYGDGVLRLIEQAKSGTAGSEKPDPVLVETRSTTNRLVLDALAARETNDAEKAIELASKAIAAGELPTDPYTIKASCQGDLGQHEAALETIEAGIVACELAAIEPAPLINERGFQKILSGNPDLWLSGWRDWEVRPQRTDIARNLAAAWPELREWDGSRDKVVLVACDKGLGDTVLFARYLSVLVNAGCKLQFNCSKASEPFAPVLRGRPNVLGAYGGADSIPKMSEMWVSLESLPKYAPHLGPDSVPPPINLGPTWIPTVNREKPRVGICWHGATGYAAAKHRRPEDPALWERLAKVPGIEFVSLQLGESGFCRTALPPSSSIVDTAKVACSCDVVVTVDTSVAHVAASCGIPTWVPMHRLNYWPWVKFGEDRTIWYSSMRFFRQTSPNDWDSVFEAIAEELRKLRGWGSTSNPLVVEAPKNTVVRKRKK